jgi:hypothetical protein
VHKRITNLAMWTPAHLDKDCKSPTSTAQLFPLLLKRAELMDELKDIEQLWNNSKVGV